MGKILYFFFLSYSENCCCRLYVNENQPAHQTFPRIDRTSVCKSIQHYLSVEDTIHPESDRQLASQPVSQNSAKVSQNG